LCYVFAKELALPSRNKGSYSIQAVENALDLLEALSEGEEEVRISQLSERLAMNKTSVFRLLATLEGRGYVEREADSGKYRLGLSAYEIGQKFLSRMVLLRQARPIMDQLARECNEVVYLVLRSNQEALFLDVADVGQQVKIVSLTGRRYPLETTAAGRVLLAFQKQSVNESQSPVALTNAEIMAAQHQGYLSDAETLGEGIASAAAPVLGSGGKPQGALCLVGPTYRLPEATLRYRVIPQLLEACRVVSLKLGWHGHYSSR